MKCVGVPPSEPGELLLRPLRGKGFHRIPPQLVLWAVLSPGISWSTLPSVQPSVESIFLSRTRRASRPASHPASVTQILQNLPHSPASPTLWGRDDAALPGSQTPLVYRWAAWGCGGSSLCAFRAGEEVRYFFSKLAGTAAFPEGTKRNCLAVRTRTQMFSQDSH